MVFGILERRPLPPTDGGGPEDECGHCGETEGLTLVNFKIAQRTLCRDCISTILEWI